MSAATVSNFRPGKARKCALSPAACVAFKVPIKTETDSVLPSSVARSRGVFPSPSRYSISACASAAAFSSATAAPERQSQHAHFAGRRRACTRASGTRILANIFEQIVSFAASLARRDEFWLLPRFAWTANYSMFIRNFNASG